MSHPFALFLIQNTGSGEVEVENFCTCPWTPRRLVVPAKIDASYEVVSCTAGVLRLPVTGDSGEKLFDFEVPREHRTCETITLRARLRSGAPLVRFTAMILGDYE